jgi:hypothetical protein
LSGELWREPSGRFRRLQLAENIRAFTGIKLLFSIEKQARILGLRRISQVMKPHEIVRQVLDRFAKLADKLADLTNKTAETFRSHGREPKTHNPSSSGNVSPVTHFMQYARQFEACEKGAGLMLVSRVAGELELEFTGEAPNETFKEFLDALITESGDVLKELNNCDTGRWRRPDYAYAETQCDELAEIAQKCKAKFRSMRKNSELKAVA